MVEAAAGIISGKEEVYRHFEASVLQEVGDEHSASLAAVLKQEENALRIKASLPEQATSESIQAVAAEFGKKFTHVPDTGVVSIDANVRQAIQSIGPKFQSIADAAKTLEAQKAFLNAVEGKLTGSGNIKVEDVKAAFNTQRDQIEQTLAGKGIDLGALKAGELKGLKYDEVVEKVAKSFSTQHAKDAGKVIEGIETTAAEISKGMHVSGDAAKAAFSEFLANVKENAQTLTPDELNTVFKKTGDKGIALGKLEEGANKLAAQLKAAGTDASKRTKALEGFDKDMAKLAEESTKALSKEGGWLAKKFIKPSLKGIGEEFSIALKEDKLRFTGKTLSTGVGAVLGGHGLVRAFSTDQETGESHPVSGLIETGAGAALIAAGLLARGKVGGASVGL